MRVRILGGVCLVWALLAVQLALAPVDPTRGQGVRKLPAQDAGVDR